MDQKKQPITLTLEYHFAARLVVALKEADAKYCGYSDWQPDELTELIGILEESLDVPEHERW